MVDCSTRVAASGGRRRPSIGHTESASFQNSSHRLLWSFTPKPTDGYSNFLFEDQARSYLQAYDHTRPLSSLGAFGSERRPHLLYSPAIISFIDHLLNSIAIPKISYSWCTDTRF